MSYTKKLETMNKIRQIFDKRFPLGKGTAKKDLLEAVLLTIDRQWPVVPATEDKS